MTLSLFDEPDIFAGMTSGGDDRFSASDRWYQKEAVLAAEKELADSRSTLIVMATGLGKTRVVSSLISRWTHGKVLVLCHRDELVQQMRAELERALGVLVEIEQGDMRASLRADYVVASTDTIRQMRRLERFPKDHFSLIVTDEAHHYLAKTYKRILDYFEGKVLGVTATPDRTDEKALGQLYDTVSYVLDIEDGIDAGYLVPIVGERVVLNEIKLDDVAKTRGGDLNESQLDEVMLQAVEGIVQKVLEHHPDRQGIAFFPGVRSAEYAMQRFNQLRPNSAIFIDGMTDKMLRRRLVEDFRAGRYKILCNCAVATEGFDAPGVSLIVQGRPTMSRSLYCQMCGRGTRVLPGTVDRLMLEEQKWERQDAIVASAKKNCVIMDFVGNSGKHALVTLEDALGGKYSDEEIERAKKLRSKGGDAPMDAREALQEARRELLAMAQKIKAQVKATVSSFDPFHVLDVGVREKDRYAQRFGLKPASEGQLAVLRLKGVPESDLAGLSHRAAGNLLTELNNRRSAGLANYKQLRQLQRFGVNDRNVTFERASEVIDYIAKCGWNPQRVDPVKLSAILHRGRDAGEEG